MFICDQERISREIDLGVDLSDVLYSLGPILIGASSFSFWVTAVVNAERCCCVTLHLKVKQICRVKNHTRFDTSDAVASNSQHHCRSHPSEVFSGMVLSSNQASDSSRSVNV